MSEINGTNNDVLSGKLKSPTEKDMEKRPWCHKIYVPVSMGEQVNVPGMGATVRVKTDLSLFKCIEGQCALWESGSRMCSDKLQAISLAKIASLMQKQDETSKFIDITG